jgi:hypothetical protein
MVMLMVDDERRLDKAFPKSAAGVSCFAANTVYSFFVCSRFTPSDQESTPSDQESTTSDHQSTRL